VLSWDSDPSELSPPRFRVRSLASIHAAGQALYLVHLRASSRRGSSPRPGHRRLDSRAQDPSIRRVYRTPRITVGRRPSSPSAHERSRAPAASSGPWPLEPRPWSVLPVPPLGGTPRLPALGGQIPRKGAGCWTSKTQLLEPLTTHAPCEARWRARPSRSSPSSPVAGWTPAQVAFATWTR